MSTFGPTFGDELHAAGLGGLPLVWRDDGTIDGRSTLTPAQNATLDAVIAAHDNTKQTAPELRKQAFQSDADYSDLLARLSVSTPAQIKTYVANNVTDLPSAKALLAKILLLIGLLAR